MIVDGKTRVCGIIANPVEHSMSPLLQNLYAKRTGVNLAYVPFKVKEEDVGAAVRGAYGLNILGLNVTVPHKQSVMKYLADIDETAAAIGAVNTLVQIENGYKGYNTDVPGLLRAVREAGFRIAGRECILLGAGGAANAAAYMLLLEGASKIYLLNRNRKHAEILAYNLNCREERECVIPMDLSDYGKIPKGSYFVVQSTSVGMHPNVDEAPIEDPAFYEMVSEAIDMIYTPAETKFMKYVKAAGGRVVNGLNMLLYQGVVSYELWNPGVTVSQETIDEAREKIKALLIGREKRRVNTRKLILIGFMGAGKTSVGAAYAEKYGIPMVDTDARIEEKTGMIVSDIFATLGEETFRHLETQVLQDLLEEPGPMIISVGGGLPLREENRELLNQLGTVICLKVTPDTVLKRLKGDTTRPLLQGGDVRHRVEELLATRNPLYETAANGSVIVDGKNFDQIVEELDSFANQIAG